MCINLYSMKNLLHSPCGECSMIGPEKNKGEYFIGCYKIKHFSSNTGSERLIASVGDEPVAVMQLMKKSRSLATITNIYCANEHRRQGFVTALYAKARFTFGKIELPTELSSDGAAWVAAISKINKKPESATASLEP